MTMLTVYFSGSLTIDSSELKYQNVENEEVISYDQYVSLSASEQDKYCIMSFSEVLDLSNDVAFEELDISEDVEDENDENQAEPGSEITIS